MELINEKYSKLYMSDLITFVSSTENKNNIMDYEICNMKLLMNQKEISSVFISNNSMLYDFFKNNSLLYISRKTIEKAIIYAVYAYEYDYLDELSQYLHLDKVNINEINSKLLRYILRMNISINEEINNEPKRPIYDEVANKITYGYIYGLHEEEKEDIYKDIIVIPERLITKKRLK